jgi:hypothetical protein
MWQMRIAYINVVVKYEGNMALERARHTLVR